MLSPLILHNIPAIPIHTFVCVIFEAEETKICQDLDEKKTWIKSLEYKTTFAESMIS